MAKILVIDDSKEIVTMVSTVLKKENYDVISATEGVIGLRMAREEKPDLLILDIEMPGTDGAEVAQVLSKEPQTAGIPIIFFSCYITKELESTGRRQAGRYVLAKPVSIDQLLDSVKHALSKKEEESK